MPYDPLMRWETEGGATRPDQRKRSWRSVLMRKMRSGPYPWRPAQASGLDQGWIRPRRIA
jgi:hypothetical protein